ncbi:MAG: hypothetical protein LBG92_10075 [Prevotellaceae bacterium]|jgi:hypothetical protein|nr:hypothetical protein [Prevotellaceae bacterium]
MKSIICQIMIGCMVLNLVSCNKNKQEEKLYESFGVVKENGAGNFYIKTDMNNCIVPVNEKLTAKDKNARVWLLFLVKDGLEKADTVKAEVQQLLRISGVEIKTDGLSDLKNDPVNRLNAAWLAQDYLTLSLDLSSFSPEMLGSHKYFLYKQPSESVIDTVHIELRYDKNGDMGDRRYTKLLAVETAKIFDTIQKPSVVALKYLKRNSDKPDEIYVKIE